MDSSHQQPGWRVSRPGAVRGFRLLAFGTGVAAVLTLAIGGHLARKESGGSRIQLLQAVELDAPDRAGAALKAGADPNTRSDDGRPALQLAAQEGNDALLEVLLNAGAAVEARDLAGRTALLWAIRQGHLTTTDLLLSRRADPFAVDSFGNGAVASAVASGEPEMLRLVLRSRCPVNLPRADGHTPLMSALQRLGSGLSVPGQEFAGQAQEASMVSLLLHAGADVNARGKDHLTPLMLAAAAGSAAAVQALLARGASPDAKTERSETPLFFAALSGDPTTISVLLAHYEILRDRTDSGWTVLHAAARGGHAEAVALLLRAGAAVNVRDKSGDTPLILASKHRSVTGNIPNPGHAPVDGRGFPRLYQSARQSEGDSTGLKPPVPALPVNQGKSFTRTLSVLLRAGADPRARDDSGRSAIIYAAGCGNAEAVRLLLAAGAPVDERDHTGVTALLFAARNGHDAVVRELLRHGADPTLRDQSGLGAQGDPAHAAYPEIARLLSRSPR